MEELYTIRPLTWDEGGKTAAPIKGVPIGSVFLWIGRAPGKRVYAMLDGPDAWRVKAWDDHVPAVRGVHNAHFEEADGFTSSIDAQAWGEKWYRDRVRQFLEPAPNAFQVLGIEDAQRLTSEARTAGASLGLPVPMGPAWGLKPGGLLSVSFESSPEAIDAACAYLGEICAHVDDAPPEDLGPVRTSMQP